MLTVGTQVWISERKGKVVGHATIYEEIVNVVELEEPVESVTKYFLVRYQNGKFEVL